MHARRRMRDEQVMFVVQYQDGSRAFVRVPPKLAMYGAGSPVVLRQAGAIARLVQVR